VKREDGHPMRPPHVIRQYEYPAAGRLRDAGAPMIGRGSAVSGDAALQTSVSRLPLVGAAKRLQEFMLHAGAANVRDGRITLVCGRRGAFAQPGIVHQNPPAPGRLTANAFAGRSVLYGPDAGQEQRAGQFATGARRSIRRLTGRSGTRRGLWQGVTLTWFFSVSPTPAGVPVKCGPRRPRRDLDRPPWVPTICG